MIQKITLICFLFSTLTYTALAGNPQIVGDSELLADLTEKVGPAVVNIDWENKSFDFESRGNPFNKFYSDREVPLAGAGSGVIIDAKNGYIITNEHVIHDADKYKINVTLLSGKKLTGKVIGVDRKLDIAIIQVSAKGLPEARLGNSQNLRPGQWVIAIGNPYRFSNTVTFGIISALSRDLDTLDKNNLIQTDAPINPGNSGGPLINMKGEVIGINVAVDTRATGIGFAIPINPVKDILKELIKKGKVLRPWLGVYMRNLESSRIQGVLVLEVVPKSPADRAGLEKDDVIQKLDGQSVKDSKQLAELVAKYNVGQKVLLEYWRDGEFKKVNARIGEQP